MARVKEPVVDINRATRKELIEIAGLPEAIADAVLLRRNEAGRFVSHDALQGVAGINEGALERIRATTKIMNEAGKEALEISAAVSETARATAQEGTKRMAEMPTELRDNVEDFARAQAGLAQAVVKDTAKVSGMATDAGRRFGAEMSERASDVTQRSTKLNAAWMSYWPEQIGDAWQTSVAMTRCRSLPEMMQLQTKFWQSSIERGTRLFAPVFPHASTVARE